MTVQPTLLTAEEVLALTPKPEPATVYLLVGWNSVGHYWRMWPGLWSSIAAAEKEAGNKAALWTAIRVVKVELT